MNKLSFMIRIFFLLLIVAIGSLLTGIAYPIIIGTIIGIAIFLVVLYAALDYFVSDLEQKIHRLLEMLYIFDVLTSKIYFTFVSVTTGAIGIAIVLSTYTIDFSSMSDPNLSLTVSKVIGLFLILLSIGVGYNFWYWLINRAIRKIPGYKP